MLRSLSYRVAHLFDFQRILFKNDNRCFNFNRLELLKKELNQNNQRLICLIMFI